MPRRAPLPCRHRGCAAVVQGGGYCSEHRAAAHQHYDARRQSAARRGYGRRWQKVRRMKLARDPLCEKRTHCRGAPATEVDHKDGDVTNNAPLNLQSTCKPCHSAKTVREQGALGHKRREHHG